MNSSFKNHLVAAIGEIVGTTMFLFFAFAGTAVANVNSSVKDNTTTNETTGFDPQKLLYISLSFGFSLMVNVWIFFRISGGLFNPAVTLALFLTGAIGFVRAVLLCLSQFVGAIIASALLLGLFPAKINVRTTLSKGLSMQRGVFIEAFLTAELVFCILMLAKEKHKATFIAPIGIGKSFWRLALFIAELAGVYWTGGSLNPARSIGPCIVTWTWDSTHWVYCKYTPWVGPLIGSLMAVLFYKFIKMMEYEMANPGQDADIFNDPTKNPYHNVRERQRIVTERVLRSLGYDPNPGFYGHTSIERMEGLGSIELYHNKTPGSLHAGSGNAPWFGPLGTPIRKSEDDAYRIAPPGSAGSAEQGPMRHN
ncbi:aquaporin-like protein [Tothia fuscella]|uniref:Aquaporin-like protein n=1 Tax=Tothia fuscella TaxID=1048955 RepID=A0A9P4P091_9PEZI|nr:aquaporin-like protein [Tothia fuscella]